MSHYDAWLEGPYTNQPDSCENCDDDGCHMCDREKAEEYRWAMDPRV
jgi:hypothetical protein